ncbi:hypothetical protein [Agromyces sp. NPDC057865]|uniref:hypothetical protein n=1 Tax=Agromyces sp. NPDC057865 TaxID=3346267 RepID=UPI00367232CC
MTTNTKTKLPVSPGDQIHFLQPHSFGISDSWLAGEYMARRGETVTITDAIIEQSIDREGNSWLALADDPDAQVARWGRVVFGIGPWPEAEPVLVPGSVEWTEAREIARKAAWSLQDPEARAAARRKVTEDFGAAPTTSSTLQHIAGD